MLEPVEDRRALYLRWRPRSFHDVVGQDHVVRTLRNAVAAGTPAHAYLLCGPRGTGKTSLARILFRAVNCLESANGDPCGSCRSCRAALENRALDLIEIDAASNRGIDDIRELREKVAYAPSDARFRVYIIDEAHELTAPAWDAFLKTLEEPPPHAIFVLATTEAHKVPSTIVSRCQRFDLRRIRPDAIKQRLVEIATSEGLQLDDAAADRLSRMARGGLRDAVSLLDQAASFSAGRVDVDALREVLGLADRRRLEELLEAVSRGDQRAAMAQVVDLATEGADLRLFADELVGHLRALLFSTAGAGAVLGGEYSLDETEWIEREAPRWDPAALTNLVKALVDGLTRTRDGTQFQLHLELSLLEASSAMSQTASVAGQQSESAATVPAQIPAQSAPLDAFGPDTATTERVAGSSALPRRPLEPAAEKAQAIPVHIDVAEVPAPDLSPLASRESEQVSVANGLQGLRQAWPKILDWIAHRNSFVASYLQPAELRELRDDDLYLSFSFRLHHDRVEEVRNRELVEQACVEIYGRQLRVFCEYSPPRAEAGGPVLDAEDPLLKHALQRFGGRVEWLDA